MWDYNDKVKDHFLNPRNVGEIENPDGVGDVGNLRCGDALKLYIKVDKSDGEERISDIKFQTFGCASAIAAASAMTEIAKGMTLDEVAQITNQDIVEYLGGLPAAKIHCSVMGAEALHAAIADYRGEEPQAPSADDNIICECFEITEKQIRDAVFRNNLTTAEQVTNYTKAGGACGQCIPEIERIIGEVLTEKAAMRCDIVPENERDARIRQVLAEEIAPELGVHGGGLQLVAIEGDKVIVVMQGACQMCANLQTTVNDFVEKKLREQVDENIVVEVGG